MAERSEKEPLLTLEIGALACSWFYDLDGGKRYPRNGTEQVTYEGDDGLAYTEPFCGLHAPMILEPSDR